ncbi:hypothetical protein [Aeoliella sp.]|uniref:hypothetical protein n=1 Tax=Aeoliella sp. TaxID=2795800 RepID=UPI003CCC16A1
MRRTTLFTAAIALLPCVWCSAGESRYAALPVDPSIEPVAEVPESNQEAPAVAPASFAAPPAPATPPVAVEPAYDPMSAYNPMAAEMPVCLPQVSDSLDGCSHWFGGVDVGITTVSHTNSTFAFNKNRTGLSLQPYVGWESYSGAGFRVQAWLFGVETEAFTAGTGAPFDIETGAAVIDFDLYKRLQIDDTRLVVGVGGRAVGIGMTFPDDTEDSIGAGGLSAFVDGYHPFYVGPHSEWGFIGGGRISALSGEAELDNLPAYSRTDGMMPITEANLGIQYLRHREFSAFLMQLQVEKQLWHTNIFGQFTYTTTALRFGWEW